MNQRAALARQFVERSIARRGQPRPRGDSAGRCQEAFVATQKCLPRPPPPAPSRSPGRGVAFPSW
eukprot:2259408-Pyramimonas_sp.AAC.1